MGNRGVRGCGLSCKVKEGGPSLGLGLTWENKQKKTQTLGHGVTKRTLLKKKRRATEGQEGRISVLVGKWKGLTTAFRSEEGPEGGP